MFVMVQRTALIGLAFFGSVGMTLLIVGCATGGKAENQDANWFSFFVVVFYLLAPIPFLISKRHSSMGMGGASNSCQELAIFLTIGIVISSFGLPIVLARHPAVTPVITPSACWFTMGANIVVYLTILGFFLTFGNEDAYSMWKIRKGFIVFHLASILMGGGMITLAILVRNQELKVLRQLHAGVTEGIRITFYAVGGITIFNSVLGFVAIFKRKKAYLWMIYCIILGFLVLVIFTASGSAVSLELSILRTNVFTLMENYEDDTRRQVFSNTTTALLDNLQQIHRCCGVDGFRDWQDVEFGRTSLKVPRSCCKLLSSSGETLNEATSSSRNLSAQDSQTFNECGLLCLPNPSNVGNFLYTGGCFDRIFGMLILFNTIMGWVGLGVGFVFAIGFVLTAYLIGSNAI